MNSNIKHILRHHYKWTQVKFWKTIGLNALCLIPIYSSQDEEDWFLTSSLAIIISIFFWSKSSWTSPKSELGFSWKFLLSLPITKKEMLISAGIINVYNGLPFLFTVLLISQKAQFNPLRVLAFWVPLVFMFGSLLISDPLSLERVQYFKNRYKILLGYTSFKIFIYRLTVFTLAIALSYYFFAFLGISFLIAAFDNVMSAVSFIYNYWIFVPILIFFVYKFISSSLRFWESGREFYPEINWQPKRDIPRVGFCLFVLSFFVYYAAVAPSAMVSGNELMTAIEDGDKTKVLKLLNAGENPNKFNKYGINSFMVAAFKGNLEIYRTLEVKTAPKNGRIKGYTVGLNGMDILLLAINSRNEELVDHILDSGFKGHTAHESGYHAIHLAAIKCMTKTVDKLIQKGADPHSLSINKRTPLHNAARANCYSTAVSLMEHQVDPNKKDNFGKTAIDYAKLLTNIELAYYLEKQARRPAATGD